MVGTGSKPPRFAVMMLALLSWLGCFTSSPRLAGAALLLPAGKSEANPAPEQAGPTLHLDYGRGESPGNPVAALMYFVPLISLEPVSVVQSPGNTQRVRMVSATRSFRAKSFLVTCEFEFLGVGNQQNVFDHTAKVRQHERDLKEGRSLVHQLGSISIEGAGSVSIAVEGTMSGHVPTVTEVRLRFNGLGPPSPVTIRLHDIRYFDGAFQLSNERVARVSTLVFRRKPGSTDMDITVASVNRKDAGDNLLQNIMAGVKATTVNLLIKPIAVEPVGNEAMLNFGLALALEAPAFTFPRARNLKAGG